MKDLSHKIEHEISNIHGLVINPADIVETQRELVRNKIIPIPNSFMDFLETYNGICYNGGEIFGIKPTHRISGDILEVNLKQERLPKLNYLILGVDDMDYLIYNQEKLLYQIVDKGDLEVLEEYQDVESAISYILKV